MKTISYITPCNFDAETSSTFRIINVCRALSSSSDYRTSIICRANDKNKYFENYNVKSCKRGTCFFSKILYYFLFPFFAIKTINKETPDVVIMYSLYGLSSLLLFLFCKFKGIKVIYDAIEWYSFEGLKRISCKSIAVNFTLRILFKNFDGVISISRFFEDYCHKKGIKTIRIPPIFLSSEYNKKILKSTKTRALTFIYAGVPGNKDYLENFILAIQNIEKKREIRFDIFGCTYQMLEKIYSNLKIDKSCIKCHGYVEQKELLKYYSRADFSVLVRNERKRNAKAGFSTKFVESMKNSIPVIANITGDLDLYLKDNYNGIVLHKTSKDYIEKKILQILEKKSDELESMRLNSFCTFEKNFRISSQYSDLISFFISSILENK